jgi:hypothetical protein
VGGDDGVHGGRAWFGRIHCAQLESKRWRLDYGHPHLREEQEVVEYQGGGAARLNAVSGCTYTGSKNLPAGGDLQEVVEACGTRAFDTRRCARGSKSWPTETLPSMMLTTSFITINGILEWGSTLQLQRESTYPHHTFRW